MPNALSTDFITTSAKMSLNVTDEDIQSSIQRVVTSNRDEVSESAALILAILDLAHERGFEEGKESMEEDVRAAIRRSKRIAGGNRSRIY